MGHEGEKIAAVTNVNRYFAAKIISGADTGKIALYIYTTNSGNQLSGLKRLGASASGDIVTTLGTGGAVYNTGAWTTDVLSTAIVPEGSPIYEVNIKGVPFVKSYALGRHAIIAGWGALSTDGGEVPGQRILQEQDYGRIYGLGYQQVWGCRAAEDANNMVKGYVLIESAYTPAGWPSID